MIKSSVVSIILVFTTVIVNARKTRSANTCPPEINCDSECQNYSELRFLGMSCRRGKLQDIHHKRYLHWCEYYDTSSERGRRYFLRSIEEDIGDGRRHFILDQKFRKSFAPRNSSECKTDTEAMILLLLKKTWRYDSCCVCSRSRLDHYCRNPDSDFQKYLNPPPPIPDLPKVNVDPCSGINCKVECMDYHALWFLGDACRDGELRRNPFNRDCERYDASRWPMIKRRFRISNENLAAPKDEAECKKYADATYLHQLKATWKYDSCCECGAKVLGEEYRYHASNLDYDCKDPDKEFQKYLSKPMPINGLKFCREHRIDRCDRE